MRMVFGLLGLCVALLIVAMLARQQLSPPTAQTRPIQTPGATPANAQQIQEQLKKDLNKALQEGQRNL